MVTGTLFLDCGNTACKYRLDGQGGRLADVGAVLELICRRRPARVVVATVSRLGQVLCERLESEDIAYDRLRVRDGWRGLALAYTEPATLGVDRWLTLVAVAGRQQPVIVIDAGTALTLDAIDAGDRHQGGYILPGLALMRRSLVDDTFALPAVELAGQAGPGRNTADCIANGAMLALSGAVEQAVRHYALDQPAIVWTGGDAEAIRLHSALPGELKPGLVFDGMKRLIKDKRYMESLT